jgi:hypothetical protein
MGEAWLIWRSFKRAYAVTRRHRKNLPESVLDESEAIMCELGPICHKYDKIRSDKVQADFKSLLQRTEGFLNQKRK